MKKSKRIGMLIEELLSNPNKLFKSSYFCGKFGIAKSSLSEDLKTVAEIFSASEHGTIKTVSGAGGGIKFVPGFSEHALKELQTSLCCALDNSSRILGGKFLYTSDLLYNSFFIRNMALAFSEKFKNTNADYVATIETKGIPLASAVAFFLNIPMVVIRREPRYSEGSTVSINYFSGVNDRIHKMSISKRAVIEGKSAIIIDDFTRGGGTIKGITEILSEFKVSVSGAGVAIASRHPEKKKISNYSPIVYLDKIDEENGTVKASGNISFF